MKKTHEEALTLLAQVVAFICTTHELGIHVSRKNLNDLLSGDGVCSHTRKIVHDVLEMLPDITIVNGLYTPSETIMTQFRKHRVLAEARRKAPLN